MHITDKYSLDLIPIQVINRAALRNAASNPDKIPPMNPSLTSTGLNIPGVVFLLKRPVTSKTLFSEGPIGAETNEIKVTFSSGGKKKVRLNRPVGYQKMTVSTAMVKAIMTISWSRYLRRKHGNKLGYGPEQDALLKLTQLLDYPSWADSVPTEVYDLSINRFLLENGSYHGLSVGPNAVTKGEISPLYIEAEVAARQDLNLPSEATQEMVIDAISDRVGVGALVKDGSHSWFVPNDVRTRTLGTGQFTPINQETMLLALGSFTSLVEALNGPTTSTFQTAGYTLSLADTFARLGLSTLEHENPSVEDYCPSGCSPRAWRYLCAGTASVTSSTLGSWSTQPLIVWPADLITQVANDPTTGFNTPLTKEALLAVATVPLTLRQRISDVMDLVVDLHANDPSNMNFQGTIVEIKTAHPIAKGLSIPCGSPLNPIISVV